MIFYGTLSAKFATSINFGIGPIDVTFVEIEYATERGTVGTTAVLLSERTRRCTAIIAGKEPTD